MFEIIVIENDSFLMIVFAGIVAFCALISVATVWLNVILAFYFRPRKASDLLEALSDYYRCNEGLTRVFLQLNNIDEQYVNLPVDNTAARSKLDWERRGQRDTFDLYFTNKHAIETMFEIEFEDVGYIETFDVRTKMPPDDAAINHIKKKGSPRPSNPIKKLIKFRKVQAQRNYNPQYKAYSNEIEKVEIP